MNHQAPTSAELAPCPLCGAAPTIEDMAGWEIFCKCGLGLCLDKPDRGPLVAAWNRRAAMQTAEPVRCTDCNGIAGQSCYCAAPDRAPSIAPVLERGTVGELRATLAPFDDAMAINAAFFVEYQGKRECRVKPLTVSRERVEDGKWIRTGDESVPYSLIAWANPNERAPSIDSAADAKRLRFAMQDIDGFGDLVMDKYDYAIQIAEAAGRDVPSADDELNGIRKLIDAAMSAIAALQPEGE